MKLHEKYGELNKWTKNDLSRLIVKHMYKMDNHPSSTDIRVKRQARNEKQVLMHRAEIVLNKMALSVD